MENNTLKFCVYKITNQISNKSYIGKTKDLKRRWNGHKAGAKRTKLNTKFPNALRKYPEDTWDVSILYETDDENHCYEVEALLIEEHNTFKFGYNSCGGGISGGTGKNSTNFEKHWSQERKEAVSGKNSKLYGTKWSQERKDSVTGENHPRSKTKWSQEQKDAVSGENNRMFGKRWNWSQEQKDAHGGKNHPMFGKLPWKHHKCKSNGLQINWFYLDKIYELKLQNPSNYKPAKIYKTLVKIYPNIKQSSTCFRNMIIWIEKNENPYNNPAWLEFKNNYKFD